MRFTKPGDPSATGAHYDLTYLRSGTDRLVTAWIPIGDVPVAMGGLVYLDGSHTAGRAMEAEFAREHAHLPMADRIVAFNKTMNDGGWITRDLPGLADRLESPLAGRRLHGRRRGAAQPVHDPRRDLQTTRPTGVSASRPTSAIRTSATRLTRAGRTTGRSATCCDAG